MAEQATDDRVAFMQQLVDLDYKTVANPVARRFEEKMVAGTITGHRCPECQRVYVPPKGFCPLCTVITGPEHEVEVEDRGTITSFTVLTPIQYRGQEEREPYALASVLLDGASSTVGTQRIEGVPLDEIRTGMRVKAVWAPEGERRGDGAGGRWGLGAAIRHWEPSGEPDADRDDYQAHML